jgi:hypothetical protein
MGVRRHRIHRRDCKALSAPMLASGAAGCRVKCRQWRHENGTIIVSYHFLTMGVASEHRKGK